MSDTALMAQRVALPKWHKCNRNIEETEFFESNCHTVSAI